MLSDKFLLAENLVEGGVALSGGADEAGAGDEGGFAVADGAVGVDLDEAYCTSAMESWMEEWSLEVMIWSV